MGGYLIGLIFLMLLMSVGYSNNLLLIFTLVLFGMNLIWLVQTHFHLHALSIQSVRITDGYAGESHMVHLDWGKTPHGPLQWEVWLEDELTSVPVKISSSTKEFGVGEIFLEKRGVRNFRHVRIKTERPFGLYQVWCYYKVDITFYVYPRKLNSNYPLEVETLEIDGEEGRRVKGINDFWALSPYQGEDSKKISWKHYARSGELVVKDGEEQGQFRVHFKLVRASSDQEFLLSKLATQMSFCHQTQVPFSFESFDKKIPLGDSQKHLTDCLRELAKC
jgi:uncharacterized protein (DUF58 family)